MTTAHLICFIVGLLLGGLAMVVAFIGVKCARVARHRAALNKLVQKLPK